MPLIIFSGLPSSGKTTRALQLQTALEAKIATSLRKFKVHVINDDSLGINREVYREARSEKAARATFYSAVQRVLSKDDIVIADGMNYIKGFRYQLFCEAKALATPHCVIQTGTPPSMCEEWNKSHPTPYPDQIFSELLLRYEEPNPATRWDSPLFTVIYDDANLPIDDIWAAITNTKTKPNLSTMQRAATDPDSLYELEKSTQDVVTIIMQQKQQGGGSVKIPGVDKALEVPIDGVSLAQLQRLKRTFVQYQRNHPAEKGRIKELFVDYLNTQFE